MFIEWKFRRKVHILFIRHFLGRLLRWTVIRYIHDKIIMHIFYVNLWKLHRALTELNHKLWRVLPSTIKMMVCCSGPHFFSLTIISFYRIVITHKSIVPTNREEKNGRWKIMRQWLVILHKAWAKNSLEQFKKCAFNWKLCKKLAISFFLSLSRRVHRRILYFLFNFLLFRNLIKHSMLRCEQSEKKLTHRQWKTLTVLFKLDWAHLLFSHPCASDGCFNVAMSTHCWWCWSWEWRWCRKHSKAKRNVEQ